MSKVLTFSRFFPKGHLNEGKPTHFVEKIYRSLDELGLGDTFYKYIPGIIEFDYDLYHQCDPKHHTIRVGKRWKVGDKFSPRVWSGLPYRSRQIKFAPDIEIKKIWDFEMDANGVESINGFYLPSIEALITLANNDGLSQDDYVSWFRIHPKKKDDYSFSGQIICWSENIHYT